jgi:hypothetical protein
MVEAATTLSAWHNFYVIVGSSGGALIGLQFVVVTLIADGRRRTTAGELHAFGTPTVVHFGGALFVSGLMTAPWHSLARLSVAIGLVGIAGIAYSGVVINRARRQRGYKPVLEDWVWYVALPALTYAALMAAALWLRSDEHAALFGIAGSALGLLVIGIHNAWDTVTHLVISSSKRQQP